MNLLIALTLGSIVSVLAIALCEVLMLPFDVSAIVVATAAIIVVTCVALWGGP